MSITKGAMLISNANAVGTELVNQLGGTGYKPVEWADKINLLGINSVDAPYAIKSIQAGTYTGEERGAIQYSNCNAVGSMLNKKLNTNRGFKPVEWESAISKLTPLSEDTVSGSICEIDDGADTVPLASCVVTVQPSLSGVSSVVVKHSGINHIQDADIVQGSFNSSGADVNTVTTRIRTDNYIPLTAGTYKIENKEGYQYVVYVYSTNSSSGYISGESLTSWQTYGTTFTLANDRYVRIGWRKSNNADIIPSEIHDYILYNTTTFAQYTASLGRVVYGGTADIITGEGVDGYTRINMNELSWDYDNTTYAYGYFYTSNVSGKATNKNFVCNLFTNNGNIRGALNDGEIGVYNNTTGIRRFCVRIDSITTVAAFEEYIASGKITYELETPTDFTFTGQEVPTRLGYNAFWSDSGDTEVTYRQAPTALTRSTVSGAIASFSDADTRLTCVNAIATIPPSIAGTDTVQLVDAGKNSLDTAIAETKSNNSVNVTCDGNGTYTATGTATGGSANITFTLKTPCTIKSGMYLHIMNSPANANVSLTIQKQDNTSIYSPTLSPANRIIDLSSYVGETIYSIRLYVVNNASSEVTFSPMLCYSNTVTTFEPYVAPTTYTANLGRTVHGGSVDIVNGTGTDENGNDFTFTGQAIIPKTGTNNCYNNVGGNTEITYFTNT